MRFGELSGDVDLGDLGAALAAEALVVALVVTGGFFLVLHWAGWSPGDPTATGHPLHDDYLTATTMTFAGITACQVGTAFAARTTHASLRSIGVFSNRLLLWGIAFELVFAAAVVYLPPLQSLFATAALGLRELAVLAVFPFIVWGSDELRRWWGSAPARGLGWIAFGLVGLDASELPPDALRRTGVGCRRAPRP